MSFLIFKRIGMMMAAVSLLGGVYAADATITVGPVITVTSTKPAVKKQDMRPVTFKEFFMQYCNRVGYGVPQIYTQLTLKMTGIARGDQVYSAMQKCVYLGFVSNTTTSYKWNSPVTPKFINILISQNMHTDADLNEDSLTITRADLAKVINTLPNYQMLMSIGTQTNRGAKRNYQSPLINADGFDTLTQIYQLFKSDYRSGDKASDSVLVQGAIKGMTDSVGDIHTEYFPPAEASQFNDTLNGSFEGIGGYLDVSSGQVTVTSLIKDSPAQKAGVQAGDHIIKVDGYVIQPTDTLQSIVARIKGPAGTTVNLTIERQGTSLTVPVIRAKITVSLIDYETKQNVPLITLHTFGWGIANSRVQILTTHKNEIQNSSKIILDLRDNPGGSLQEVANMLSDFVAKDKPVVFTQGRDQSEEIVSEGRKLIDFSQKKIIILINGGTASASEIMAGTIKDYLGSNVVIMGETSYGKGSVQYLQSFDDNSSFKLTIAHWYTGKTRMGIEGVGIKPDVLVHLDPEQFKQGTDTQMQAALNY